MKQFYFLVILLSSLLINYQDTFSQVVWQKNSGNMGEGNFTISGSGSVFTLNSSSNIAFLKHGSGLGSYYTCDNCTINIQINGQFVIDYPLYITNSRIIVGTSTINTTNNTATLFVSGNSSNPKQAIFLDNTSSIELESSDNLIQLQTLPLAYIYYDYSGGENSSPPSGSKYFTGSQNSPFCGVTGTNGSVYTCIEGQVNGPSILDATGFSIIEPLPVVLVGFTAGLNSNMTVTLDWSTQMETNLSHFVIQRSADGANWENIGTVKANGNSGTASYYSFTDESPLNGLNYYRLEMIDDNNRTGLTEIKLVHTVINKPFTIFPNPANNYVDITLSKATNGKLLLLNQFGQLLQQQQISGNNSGTTLSFQLSGYPAGYYVIEVIASDGSKETGKLLIVK